MPARPLPPLLLMMTVLACRPLPQVREARIPEDEPGVDLQTPDDDDTAALDTDLPADSDAPVDTDTGTSDPADPTLLCFLGVKRDGTACLDTIEATGLGADYAWPTSSDARYRTPIRVIDLQAVDLSTQLAPNFRASEFLQAWKGRYGVLQPHAIARLQEVRDEVGGPVQVNSGFRSPAYNSSIDGATYSRHMYGDASDIYAASVSIAALGAICESLGASYVGYYTGHVHCDWRDDPLDPVLYGPSLAPPLTDSTPHHTATLTFDGQAWHAPGSGWDEGEPLREWTAFDAHGTVVTQATGHTYEGLDTAGCLVLHRALSTPSIRPAYDPGADHFPDPNQSYPARNIEANGKWFVAKWEITHNDGTPTLTLSADQQPRVSNVTDRRCP